MANEQQLIEDLQRRIAELTGRVYRLESKLGIQAPTAAPVATPPPAAAPSPRETVLLTSPSFQEVAPPRVTSSADLESKIGGQWMNRIGIIALLAGVSYFLKLAFENNWIGPSGRVAIGLLAGIAVIFWSERFRAHGHQIFSLSLKAVGVGTLYLSLWGGFHLYHLVQKPFDGPVFFTAMLLVTAFTTLLAWRQDAEILAAYALIGGFATPVLLSTGENHEIFLFNYVFVLQLGTLALIAFKPWKRLLAATFFGTLLLYTGWYSKFYESDAQNKTLAYATLFFLVFAVAPLVSRQKLSESSKLKGQISATLVGLAFFNAVAYFFEIYDILEANKSTIAWIAVAIAAIYLLLGREMKRALPADAAGRPAALMPLIYIALAVGFLTIAVPMKLDAHWITLGWLIESAVLLYIAERASSDLLRAFGATALVLALFRLLLIDQYTPERLIFNARFATYLVAIAVLGIIVYYASRHSKYAAAAAVALVAINVLALIAGSLEINSFYDRSVQALVGPYTGGQVTDWHNAALARDFSYSAFWMLYGAGLLAIGFVKRSPFLRWQALILMAFTTVKVFLYDVQELDRVYRILSLIGLGVLFMAVSYVYQRDLLKLKKPAPAAADNAGGQA
jgi:uncharacterized membrane protein